MKAPAAATLLFFVLAAPARAGLTAGPIVNEGRAIPIIADVNGDGLTDIVHDFDMLVNQGAGSFLEKSLGLEGADGAIDWLDANGDGRADLLTIDHESGNPGGPPSKQTYRIYLARPGAAYGPGVTIPTKDAAPYIAEINGDGREDLVLARQIFVANKSIATELTVLLSKGDGTFTAREPFRVPPDPQYGLYNRLAAGDIDRDGIRDLVFRTVNDLVVVRGKGDGNFGAAESRYLPWATFGGWCTELADVDGDGNLDILTAALRTIRVFYGDGRGRFPRTSTTPIGKVHEAVIPPQYVIPPPPGHPPFSLDLFVQPRTFAFGQFVAKGRFEMAAGTGEGDVVVFAWEKGALREVARAASDLLMVDVHGGSFFAPGQSDIYITWNLGHGDDRPRPRLLFGGEPETAPVTSSRDTRTRAVRGSTNTLTFDVQVTGDCISANETWTLTRESIFGREQTADRTVETVIENGVLSFRVTAPWAPKTASGALHVNGRRWEGTVEVETGCGWRKVAFVATPR